MRTERVIYTGICVGGPMDGLEGQSRFEKGFVLLDDPRGFAWVYDYHDGAIPGFEATQNASLASSPRFIAREQAILSRDKAAKAAAEDKYDVRAYDSEVMH